MFALLRALYYKYTTFVSCLKLSIKLGDRIVFKRVPFIIKHKKAVIEIGKNTLINSSNFGYHINMHSRCKLYADTVDAVISIGSNCRIHGSCIHAQKKIIIGNNCLIAANTHIIDSNGHALMMDEPIKRLKVRDQARDIIIEDNVWIAANCIILGGTFIGEGSVITAGSVVKGHVPSESIYGGNPARLIKQYN